MGIKASVIAVGCALAFSAGAGTMGPLHTEESHHSWSVIGSLGYTWYQQAYNGNSTAQAAIGDGQTALERFAIARDFSVFKTVYLGAEVGIQNGNTMRLHINQAQLNELGGLPVQTTVKPMLDLLATASYQPISTPVFGLVKAGIAYRRLQINDRVTFNDLSKVAFEIQAGLGVHLSNRASLSLNYQGIFNGNTRYVINTTEFTGHISNIPNQNGILLSLSYMV
ncbi:hypothetical protein [Legionella drancourtii]|nr:hypothetical protein [Legionella drancourtii]